MTAITVATHLLAFLLGVGTVGFGSVLVERADKRRLRRLYPEEMARIDEIMSRYE